MTPCRPAYTPQVLVVYPYSLFFAICLSYGVVAYPKQHYSKLYTCQIRKNQIINYTRYNSISKIK